MSALRLVLFGPFAVTGGAAPPAVRGVIPQAILARLALAQGALGAEELVHDLWPAPTDAVVSSLRAHVSRLRARGWGEVLHGGREGYHLDLRPDQVDVVEYELLVADRESRDRTATLVAAEALWRGDPLVWASAFPFVGAVTRRLTGLRRAALAELAHRRLDERDPAGAVAALSSLAAAVPADGELTGLLARSLARSGRTSDALAALDAHIAAAADAGAERTRILDDLRQSIIRQDPIVLGLASADAGPPVERFGIPIPLTRFVGRAREIDAIRRGRSESRLVTLIGPAGVGKTRLAIEVARRAERAEDDAQWLVDLTFVDAPADVVAALADVTDAAEPTIDAVVHVVGGRRGLLILDNAEHVLGTVATVCAAILERCAGLSVLVTSRESMRMAGERVVTVEPLLGAQVDDAVALFLHRATDSSGILEWDDTQRVAVRSLCGRLDGLPLAIELAASRLDVLTLEQLSTSLERPAPAGARGRHDSIDSAIDWSVRLTSDRESLLLSQLAVFAGTFTLEMVGGICDAAGGDPREVAVALARKSLISPVNGARERRFRVLEAVKSFVRVRLPLSDPVAWRRQHAEWLADYAERLAPQLRTGDAKAARASLAASRPDIDAAVSWAVEAGERAIALRITAALAWHWYERGSGHDAVATVEKVLALPGEPMPDAEAAALRAATFVSSVGLDPLAVIRYTARLSAAADDADDPLHAMLAGSMRAYLAATFGDDDEADAALNAAAEHRERLGDRSPWAVADYLLIRGDALRQLGRPAQALDALGESYRLAVDIGHAWALRGACYVTGKTLVTVNRPADALPILRTGAISSLEHEDAASALASVNVFAAALVQLDRAARAAELFGAVDALGDRHGFHPEGSDGEFTERARTRARQALKPAEWDAALASGRSRDLRWVLSNLDPIG